MRPFLVAICALIFAACEPPAEPPAEIRYNYRIELRDGSVEEVVAYRIESANFGRSICAMANWRAFKCWPLETVKSWEQKERK